MTEDKKTNEEILKEIETGINEEINKQFGNLNKKIDEKFVPGDKENDFSFNFDDEENDKKEFITKKDLNSFGKIIAKEILEKTEKSAKTLASQTVDEKLQVVAGRNQVDAIAMTRYEELNHNKPASYNPKFVKEVQEEIVKRISAGKDSNDPYLLLDSANEVGKKWEEKGLRVPKNVAEEEQRKLNNKDDNITVTKVNKEGKIVLNQNTLNIATKLGMNKEDMIKVLEKRGISYQK